MESVQVEINEVWRSIDRYLNYQVSNIGRVRNTETGKIFKPSVNSNGYYNVVLRKDGKPYNHKVHRLVAHEFLEKPRGNSEVERRSYSSRKLNNQVTNLRYATQSQNMMNGT